MYDVGEVGSSQKVRLKSLAVIAAVNLLEDQENNSYPISHPQNQMRFCNLILGSDWDVTCKRVKEIR